MHSYSTDESRTQVYSIFAIISVVLAWSVSAATADFEWPQWLVGPPSMGGMFALLCWLFDRYGWRLAFLRTLGVVTVPDLSGSYEGRLVSTHPDHAGKPTERNLVLRIKQTWTKISIEMELAPETSTSGSISALGFVGQAGSATRLAYVYWNRTNPAVADEDMADHEGAADLRIYEDGRLTGRYWNLRPNAGTIEAQKIVGA